MTPIEAYKKYGATHYSVMRDQLTPQMYYKKRVIQYYDGTFMETWLYLAFSDIWTGSIYKNNPDTEKYFKAIEVPLSAGLSSEVDNNV